MIQALHPAPTPSDPAPRVGQDRSNAPLGFDAALAHEAQRWAYDAPNSDEAEHAPDPGPRRREDVSPVGARAYAAATAPEPGLLAQLAAQRTDLSSLSARELATGGQTREATAQAEQIGRDQNHNATRRAGSGTSTGRAERAPDTSNNPADSGNDPAPSTPAAAGMRSAPENGRGTPHTPHAPQSEHPAASPASLGATGSPIAAPPSAIAASLAASTVKREASTPSGVQGVASAASRRADARVLVRTPANAPTRPVIHQAVQGLAAALTRKDGQVTLRLAPEQLGVLKIQLKLRGSAVEARIEASSEPARALFEQERDTLRSALESRGLTVERVEVTLRPEGQPSPTATPPVANQDAPAPAQDAPHGHDPSSTHSHAEHRAPNHGQPESSDLARDGTEMVALSHEDRGIWTDLDGGGALRVDTIA